MVRNRTPESDDLGERELSFRDVRYRTIGPGWAARAGPPGAPPRGRVRGHSHSAGQAGLAADAVAIGPEVAHAAVRAALLAFGRDCIWALASRGLPLQPLAAKDQHDSQGEERDGANKQENLGSLIHEVSLKRLVR
jgi:hypothetical protein